MAQPPDRRICIYPNQLDNTKTVAEGRSIPKELACNQPFIGEMMDCCKLLKIPAEIENKHYPRAWWIPGRLRVQLKNADGTPVNPEIPNKRTLMIKISELVPKHPGRLKTGGKPPVIPIGMPPGFSEPAGTSSEAGSSKAGGSSAGTTTNKKKSSKKK